MSRSAAARIASRVVLPSRVLAAGLGVAVEVLVVVMCTNRSVQRLRPVAQCVKLLGAPTWPPKPPSARSAPGNPGRSSISVKRYIASGPPTAAEERHGCAGTLRAAPGVKGALRGPLARKRKTKTADLR